MDTLALTILICLSAIAALAGIVVLLDMFGGHKAKNA